MYSAITKKSYYTYFVNLQNTPKSDLLHNDCFFITMKNEGQQNWTEI